MAKKDGEMKEVHYKCTARGATDMGRFFPEEIPMAIINCHKCHAGFRVEPAEQMQRKAGMIAIRTT